MQPRPLKDYRAAGDGIGSRTSLLKRPRLAGRSILLPAVLAALLGIAAPPFARAEHFDIKLLAAGPDGVTQEAYADQSPPECGLNPRPVLKARAGQKITMQFIMTNVYPHGIAKNAGIHYYVVREKEAGQKTLPPLNQGVVTEGTFTFNLKPKARIGAREHLVIREPGVYLLRVESQRTQRDHEHFSAIDLLIQ
ncbi:MAG TPA: hypothetical protein VFA54_10445 [Bryobacterales bacterium]|jgi:hypothetical protein|nr:hypothetical protein [Bryobacterales bacterium]